MKAGNKFNPNNFNGNLYSVFIVIDKPNNFKCFKYQYGFNGSGRTRGIIVRDGIYIEPLTVIKDLSLTKEFNSWLKSNKIKKVTGSTVVEYLIQKYNK